MSRGSPGTPPHTPGRELPVSWHAIFPGYPFEAGSAIRSRDISSHLCPLRGRYNAAPRGAAEPEGDDGGVDAGLEQRHGAAVAKDVWMDPFALQRRAALGGGRGVGADARGRPRYG